MIKLEINNFLSLKKVSLDVNRITILIGPQAEGKSLLAKIVYFFQSVLSSVFYKYEIFNEKENFRSFKPSVKLLFSTIFPKYTWEKTEFSMKYTDGNYWLKISNRKIGKTFRFDFKYGENLSKILLEMKNSFREMATPYKKSPEYLNEVTLLTKNLKIYKTIIDDIRNKYPDFSLINTEPLFIPASRSLLFHLQSKLFSIISHDIELDFFIKEFGSHYETARALYSANLMENRVVDKYLKEILKGEYYQENDTDYLKTTTGKIQLFHASSGQQEVLPMLIVLATLPFKKSNGISPVKFFFIEEPEAHLFPRSQKKVTELLGFLYKTTNSSFFITTHSPYILTSLNNLLLAHLAKKKGKTDKVEIRFDDVSAYQLENGTVKSILNSEYQLIDAEYIDSISDEIEEEYDRFLEEIYAERG